jgi:cysteine-rich repeat protein
MCWSCSDLLHSTQWKTRCDESPSACGQGGDGSGGAGGTGPSGGGASPGSGAASSTTVGSGGSTSSASASGGGAGGCGDGVIQPGEECDDGNTLTGDGCEACVVVCAAAFEVEDPSTRHCYRADPAATDTWSGARVSCLAWGGNLAAIGGDPEQSFVASFLVISGWLGGTDAPTEGSFGWSNGASFIYTHWNALEPNDAMGDEDCIEIYGPEVPTAPFLWNDVSCAVVLPYVCERPPPGK